MSWVPRRLGASVAALAGGASPRHACLMKATSFSDTVEHPRPVHTQRPRALEQKQRPAKPVPQQSLTSDAPASGITPCEAEHCMVPAGLTTGLGTPTPSAEARAAAGIIPPYKSQPEACCSFALLAWAGCGCSGWCCGPPSVRCCRVDESQPRAVTASYWAPPSLTRCTRGTRAGV